VVKIVEVGVMRYGPARRRWGGPINVRGFALQLLVKLLDESEVRVGLRGGRLSQGQERFSVVRGTIERLGIDVQ